MTKRVLSVIQTPTYGGPHNRVTRLSGLLRDEGFETVICLPTECETGEERMRAAGLEVHTVPIHRMRKSFNPRDHFLFVARFRDTIRQMKELMQRERIDVVQVCGLMSVHAGLAAHAAGLPVVWQLLGTFAPMPLRRILMPVVKRCADVVMVTGRRTADLHPGAECFHDRLIPFFPPVELDQFHPDAERREEVRGLLGLRPEQVLVVTVGNRNRAKSHDIFVRVAAEVSRQAPDAKFMIKGELSAANRGDYERQVMEPLRRSGLMDDGRFEFEEAGLSVPDFLRAADLFVLTSQSEGVPTALLEAMASGLPVVSTEVGSIGEIVDIGKTGFLAPSGDAIRLAEGVMKLVPDPGVRRRMGQAALEVARARFGSEQCAARHIKAYRMAAEHREAGGHAGSRLDAAAPEGGVSVDAEEASR